MDIKVKLYHPFVVKLNELKNKHGKKMQFLNGISDENLSFGDFIDNFIDSNTIADTTIDSNANVSVKDITTFMREMVKPHQKLLAMNKLFYEMVKKYGIDEANKWLELEYTGGLYMHDFATSTFLPYCYSYDLKDIAEKGLFFLDKFKTKPAKHLDTFNNHILEFISYTTNRTSGACGLSNYLIYSYYFWREDVKSGYSCDPNRYKKQQFQTFIYNLNQPYLRIAESAFTNISIIDREYFIGLFGGGIFPNGDNMIDCIDEFMEYQKEFMESVSEIRKEQMFTFPVLSYCLLYKDDKFADEEFAIWCNEHNNIWYDSNFYIGDSVDSLSNCCRLISKFDKLDGFINSIGGTQLSIGSVKVSTINLHRIALENDDDNFFQILERHLDSNLKILDIQRSIIERNIDKGLLPIYEYGLIKLKNQYSTIGITAMFECIKEIGGVSKDEFGNYFYNEKGLDTSKKIIQLINLYKEKYENGYSINVENIPSEAAGVKLALKTKIIFPDSEYYIYSNQWIGLMYKTTIEERIRLSSILDVECNGGNITHINIQSKFNTDDQSWRLLNHMAKSGVIYFAYNINISSCEDGHGFIGETCHCGNPKSDNWSRIVGFLTPYTSYSKDRKKEFDERLWYDI